MGSQLTSHLIVLLRYSLVSLRRLTRGAALAQLLVSAFGAALTQQLVVSHQQLHRGELVEAGLDGALLGAGRVTVGQRLEGPVRVLMLEVVLCRGLSWLLRRTL